MVSAQIIQINPSDTQTATRPLLTHLTHAQEFMQMSPYKSSLTPQNLVFYFYE